ncbi:hypothetical protein [Nocardia yamanashiensis]|uniref:hypothetical protein n=1 Tax=Nocardia yamanashiensis TaxID=209247 RepID=UPI00082A2393|nr:hypothetical protein [Nocardia yamanashiensis]
MHTFTTIAKSLGEVTAIALVLGAGVPLLFAVGVRLWALEPATATGPATVRDTLARTIAYLCFAVTVAVVVAGILFIARDFISHTFDIQLFGAKPRKK